MLSSFSLSWAENEDMQDRLPALTTVAPRTVEAWNPTLEEEVSQPDLARPCLDEDRTLRLVEPLVKLEDMLVWRLFGCCWSSRCLVLPRCRALLLSLEPVSLLRLVC